MSLPFHPQIVHFPIALTFILPVLILVFTYFIRANKLPPMAWLVIIGLQLATTVTGYISLESGETDEAVVQKVVEKKLIAEHESAAEIFVGVTVIALVLSIALFFLRKEMQFQLQLAVLIIGLGNCYLVMKASHLGGELTYVYGAPRAYHHDGEGEPQGLLPTPGMNTSESPYPVNENESLKADEHDYGNSGEDDETEDEDSKQED